MKRSVLRYTVFLIIVILTGIIFTAVYFGSGKQHTAKPIPASTDVFEYPGNYKITQTIEAEDLFCGVAIELREPQSSYSSTKVRILSSEGKALAEVEFNSSYDYSVPQTVTFSNFFGKDAGEYTVEIVSDGAGAPGAGYYIGGEITALFNGNVTDCSPSISPIYANRVGSEMFFTLLVGIMMLIFIIYILINSLELRSIAAFPVCVSVFLVLGMLILPLGVGIQEQKAMPSAYAVAHGDGFSSSHSVIMPSGFTAIFSDDWGYENTIEAIRDNPPKGETLVMSTSALASDPPISHLPAALGIFLAELFSDNAAVIFYFARLFTVLFSIFTLCAIMKLLPYGRRIFFAICLNPAVITLLCTVSSFGVPMLFAFILFALVLKIKESSEITSVRSVVLVSIVSLIVASANVIFLPFIFITLLILPRRRFSSARGRIIAIIFMLALPLAVGLARAIVAGLSEPETLGNIKQLFTVPAYTVRLFAHSVKENSAKIILSTFGEVIAANGEVVCGGLSSIVIMLMTFACALLDSNLKGKFSPRSKILMCLMSAASVVMILVSAYINFGRSGLELSNMLGIFLIPALLVVLFAIGDNKIKYDSPENARHMRTCVFSVGMFPFVFAMLSTVIYYV